MSSPLGSFVRAKRDATRPEAVGLRPPARGRTPGLRRSDLAARVGISPEYLTRIEQGHDRNPSPSVVAALADGLMLDSAERDHLRYLAKITGGACSTHAQPVPARRDVRPTVAATLALLEPGVALVTNRLGDLLAYTTGFAALTGGSGLLEADLPNLTRYVFTDPRARALFLDWDQVGDELLFDLWLAPSIENAEWLKRELAVAAGPAFTRRLDQHVLPARVPLRLAHPTAGQMSWHREALELSGDSQQIVVFHAADAATSHAMELLRGGTGGAMRAVT